MSTIPRRTADSPYIELDRELLSATVRSRTVDQTYAIELDELRDNFGEFNGACTCVDFEVRCLPNFRLFREVKPYGEGNADRTQCKHISAVRRLLLNEVITRLTKKEHEPPHP